MKITIKAKRAGTKRALIENRQIEISDVGKAPLLAALLDAVVRQQVEEYNKKSAEKSFLPFLSKTAIDDQAIAGKVGFGAAYNENEADVGEAQKVARQAFEDGLFSVFVDEAEIRSLDETVKLTDSTVVVFIRLTFLAGSYW